jgi:RNA polymerase sigma-70 factor (ECF subfamily)
MEDRDIIKLFYERSEQAIVELSRKYRRACRQIPFNILRNEHDVEECLNDAYLKVWNTIPPSDPESLFSYVCLATRNTAIDRLRIAKATGRPPTVDSDFDEILIHLEDPSDIESTIQSKEFNNVLNDFLRSLSRTDRILFVRRYFCCERIEFLAKALGMSYQGTAKKLARMREKLKICLSKKGYEL